MVTKDDKKDPKEIENVKQTLPPATQSTNAQQSVSEKKLRTFLESIMNRGSRRMNRNTRRSTIITDEVGVVPENNLRSEIHDKKLNELYDIIQSPDWIKKKDHKSFSMSSYYVRDEVYYTLGVTNNSRTLLRFDLK
jgi:hypothetical protein